MAYEYATLRLLPGEIEYLQPDGRWTTDTKRSESRQPMRIELRSARDRRLVGEVTVQGDRVRDDAGRTVMDAVAYALDIAAGEGWEYVAERAPSEGLVARFLVRRQVTD